MLPLEALRSARKEARRAAPDGRVLSAALSFGKIRSFLGDRAETTQNLVHHIIDTDTAMIGRIGFTAKRKGRKIALFTK